MTLLHKAEIEKRLKKAGRDGLWIDPLLETSQVGEVTVDLRLGYDFLVSILTRSSYVKLDTTHSDYRSVRSFFRLTRRDIGQGFLLYPGQVALTTTLEYVSMPSDVYADIITRSSYNRLGMHLNTMLQPGFRGCIGLELFNHGNTPIELIVGSRIVQARLISIGKTLNYFSSQVPRKYIGDVRPQHSRAQRDSDIPKLIGMSEGIAVSSPEQDSGG